MKSEQNAFSLIEIILVITIIGVLAAVAVVAFNPQDIFANGRNTRRTNDIISIKDALSQWMTRESVASEDPFSQLGLTAVGVDPLTPQDGTVTDEGIEGSSLTQLTDIGYLQDIPKDPDGVTEYRVGVDDIENPSIIIICSDKIENTVNYSEEDYPNGIFCTTL